jgi:hypothetical protein
MKTKVANFWLQPTKSFPEAPQREEYSSDASFFRDAELYSKEWLEQYECENRKCQNIDCPQHGPQNYPKQWKPNKA